MSVIWFDSFITHKTKKHTLNSASSFHSTSFDSFLNSKSGANSSFNSSSEQEAQKFMCLSAEKVKLVPMELFKISELRQELDQSKKNYIKNSSFNKLKSSIFTTSSNSNLYRSIKTSSQEGSRNDVMNSSFISKRNDVETCFYDIKVRDSKQNNLTYKIIDNQEKNVLSKNLLSKSIYSIPLSQCDMESKDSSRQLVDCTEEYKTINMKSSSKILQRSESMHRSVRLGDSKKLSTSLSHLVNFNDQNEKKRMITLNTKPKSSEPSDLKVEYTNPNGNPVVFDVSLMW